MTQTEKKNQSTATSRRGRPGQRQQERLQRLARRRRRRQIILSSIVVVVIVCLAYLGFWSYQRYSAAQLVASHAHATATAKALITPTPVAPTPTPPASTPPAVTGKTVTLSGGLQYIDIKQGVGPVAKDGDEVDVDYTGWIQKTGKMFDSTYRDGGTPFSVKPLGTANIIPGWNIGLVGMKSGGERRLIIPASLAYGSTGSGGVIPANATLIFDVTVTAIK